MQWLIVIFFCLLGGFWLFKILLGSSDLEVGMKQAPGRTLFTVVIFAVVVFVVLLVLGSLAGR